MSLFSRFLKVISYTLISIIVLLLIVWGSSFVVMPWQTNKQLQPYGLQLSDKASMSFNPFALQLQLDDVELVDNAKKIQFSLQHLHFNLSFTDLFNKRLVIESSKVSKMAMNVKRAQQSLVIAGVDLNALPTSNEPATAQEKPAEPVDIEAQLKGWSFHWPSFQIDGLAIDVEDMAHQHQIVLQSLSLSQLAATLDQFSGSYAMAVQLNGTSLAIEGNISGELKQLALTGLANSLNLELNKLAIEDWRYLLPLKQQGVTNLAGDVGLKIENALTYNGALWQLNQPRLKLNVSQLAASYQQMDLVNNQFALELTELDVAASQNGLKSLTAKVNLNNDTLALTTGEAADVIGKLGSLAIENIDVSVDANMNAAVTVAQVEISELIASQHAQLQPLLSSEKTTINGLSWQENHLAVDKVAIYPFSANVILDEKKQLANLLLPPVQEQAQVTATNGELSETENNANSVTTKPSDPDISQAQKSAVTFSLNELTLMAPAQVHFTDNSVTPVFEQAIELNTVQVGQVDSRENKALSPYNVALAFDEHSKMTATGDIAPFGKQLNMTLDVAMNELTLPPLSAYLRTVLGFDFLSGQLDNKVTLAIKDDELDGETVIDLRGFELANGDDTTDLAANDGAAIGLNAALNMLKDGDGNVSLTVPLSGNIQDPSFGISNVITLVAQKAIMSQAKSYLINTFVPYANLVTVASVAGEYLLRLEMNDLNYLPGQVELSESQQVFVDELGALLTDKPKQQVKLCPVARAGELITSGSTPEQQISALKNLSKERGNVLKNRLINHYGIESARLLVCAPKVDTDENSQPRVEFSF
ncbi:MAG: DUF748 domain-containing protein [Psychrobium sp.]